jgi:hypothetical protein
LVGEAVTSEAFRPKLEPAGRRRLDIGRRFNLTGLEGSCRFRVIFREKIIIGNVVRIFG